MIMEEKLNKIAQEIGRQIRILLKKENLYDNNIDMHFQLGKYTILYNRKNSTNPNYEPLTEFPEGFLEILQKGIIEMKELWQEIEDNQMWIGDDMTAEYNVDCIIDGEVDFSGTVRELESKIHNLDQLRISAVEAEKYENALRYKKLIENYRAKIAEANNGG